jgi:hypothetical protein
MDNLRVISGLIYLLGISAIGYAQEDTIPQWTVRDF